MLCSTGALFFFLCDQNRNAVSLSVLILNVCCLARWTESFSVGNMQMLVSLQGFCPLPSRGQGGKLFLELLRTLLFSIVSTLHNEGLWFF